MIELRPLETRDASPLLEIRTRTRAFLEPWEPARPEEFWTLEGQRQTVAAALAERDAGRAFPFAIVEDGALAGAVTLSNVVRGVFESCTIGYWVDADRGGRGLATEGVRLAVAFAFGGGRLHRVQAAVMPRNDASLRVLEKVGFREEGLALRYLRIAGAWSDHRLFALTCEEWGERGGA